jgi:hypothetical protein
VSDDKITGTGVKFKCTRCNEYVKITREEFDDYQLTHGGPSVAQAAAQGKFSAEQAAPSAPELVLAGSPAMAEEAAAVPANEEFGMRDLSPSRPEAAESPAKMPPGSYPAPPELQVPPMPAPSAEEPAPEAGAVREKSRRAASEKKEARKAKDILSRPIHPLVSGGFSGALGGLVAAIVMILIAIAATRVALKASILAQIPDYVMSSFSILSIQPADRPMSVAKYVGFGIFFGMLIAFLQAFIEKNIFAFFGLFVGTMLSAIGGSLLAFATGAAGDDPLYVLSMIVAWAIKGFLITFLLILVRKITLPHRQESFDEKLTATQVVVALFSVAVIGVAFYGEYASMVQKRAPAGMSNAALQAAFSTDGLAVTNLKGEIDPTNQDLVITGVVENATDRQKQYWHLQAEVYNAQNEVMVQARMANGKQLYARRDFDVMAKRGMDVEWFRKSVAQTPQKPVPPRGSAGFEIRIIEPPVGIASFNVALKPFEQRLLDELGPR